MHPLNVKAKSRCKIFTLYLTSMKIPSFFRFLIIPSYLYIYLTFSFEIGHIFCLRQVIHILLRLVVVCGVLSIGSYLLTVRYILVFSLFINCLLFSKPLSLLIYLRTYLVIHISSLMFHIYSLFLTILFYFAYICLSSALFVFFLISVF